MIKISIASVPDREKVVAELWIKNYQLAEISKEQEEVLVEFFCYPDIKWSEIPLLELIEKLQEANNKLS
ncbi:MAG: hypothetical protein CVU60_00030 [Deltaproteobacteria bacterium HGW-Deltaproteobacteria-18]|jgi:hypothetical protein|nr:MAG: hypothetical protein CVU60_00030 [Deltaproteobacteria bacterium HGW-Deltaproteobacteria-18]